MPSFHDHSTRAQVIALRSVGISANQVMAITGIGERTQRKMISKARERGFAYGKKDGLGILRDEHVRDGVRTGAPRKADRAKDRDLEGNGGEKGREGDGVGEAEQRGFGEFQQRRDAEGGEQERNVQT